MTDAGSPHVTSTRGWSPVITDAAVRQPDWADVDPATSVNAVAPKKPGVVGLVLGGYLDTEVRIRPTDATVGERFRWTLGPGIDRKTVLRSIPDTTRAAIADLPQTAGRLSLGWVDGEHRHHLAPGRASLASHIARHRPNESIEVFRSSAAALGTVLRQLADMDPACADELPAPAGPRRLSNWLKTGEGPWGAAVMHDRLVPLLGSNRIDEIVGWIDEMAQESVVHGRAGFGVTVVPESDAPPAVLVGDEIAYGPRDFDLAWVLGDLLVGEHMTTLAHPSAAAEQLEVITACRDAFLIAYGPAADMIATGRTTIVRVLLELHDSAAYLDRQLIELADYAPELVDSAR